MVGAGTDDWAKTVPQESSAQSSSAMDARARRKRERLEIMDA